MRSLLVWLALFPFVALSSTEATAQCQNLYLRRQQVVYAAPVQLQQVVSYVPHYQNQQVRYFLGEDLQVEALAQKLAPKLAPLIANELIKLQGSNLPAPNVPNTPNQAPDSGGLSIREKLSTSMPLFTARCARCHSGAEPSSGISFDNGMSDKSFRKFVIMFQSNTFPKPMQFIVNMSAQEKGAITEELGKFVESSNDSVLDNKREIVPPPKPNPPSNEGDLR